MLLLLVLLGDQRAKIQFEIELSSTEKDGDFDFEELTEFLSITTLMDSDGVNDNIL
jgi:hypothetical protein